MTRKILILDSNTDFDGAIDKNIINNRDFFLAARHDVIVSKMKRINGMTERRECVSTNRLRDYEFVSFYHHHSSRTSSDIFSVIIASL